MNVKDLPQGSYKVINGQKSASINIKDLPAGSFRIVGEQQPPVQPVQQKGFLQKAAGFLGIEKFGQGLASAGRVLSGGVGQDIQQSNQTANNASTLTRLAQQTADPARRTQLLQLARTMSGDTATEIDPGLNFSNKEIIGSAANVALNIATPGAFKGGFGAQIAKNTAVGAGFGLAGGLNQNESAGGVVKSTLAGGLLGGSLPVAGKVFGKAKNVFTEKLPEKIYNTAVKPTLDELRKNIKYGNETLGRELMNDGVRGGSKRLLEIAKEKLNSYENELQTTFANSTGTIKRAELKKYFSGLIETTRNTPGIGAERQKITQLLKEFPKEVSLQQANKIKRNLYNELRNVAYKLDANLTTKREAMKTLAKALKTELENKVGGTKVANINKKLSIYGRLEDRIVDVLARENKNNFFGLTDNILAGAGFIEPTAFLGLVTKKAIGSTFGKTNIAVGLNKLGKMGGGKTGAATKAFTKRMILNAP